MKRLKNKIFSFLRQHPRWRLVMGVILILAAGFLVFRDGKLVGTEITFAVKRGDLQISVIEGGSIEAQQSLELRSEVKGTQGKILKIVEEGYQVTEDDVKNGKILVELDGSELRERVTQQEIQYQSAVATFTEAAQSYEIQRNQNTSNIKAAEQKAQFAKMDFEKFLGDTASAEMIRILKLDKLAAAAAKIASGEDAEQLMLSAMQTTEDDEVEEIDTNSPAVLTPASLPGKPRVIAPVKIDFTKYAKAEMLGDGSAMQQLRKLTDDLQSAQQQEGISKTRLAGTRRLFENKFATQTELETDEISAINNALKVQTAETAYNLFIKYEFPKQAQELLSKYEEALRSLEREKKEAISRLAQSKARLKGAESRYSIESTQRKQLQEQIEKCTIRAEKPGLVVYGGGSAEGYSNEQIREGATVRERQPIITIPDMAQMSVRVRVHESYIQKVEKGLKARIQVDAYPDKQLTGEVIKVAMLPDSQNRWINPDLKVYQTTVLIEGTHEWLKPGMSAKVEILVKHITDTVYVPLQAISERSGKQFCYVVNGHTELREVTVGDFNDDFIEIKSGLKEGEEVLLRAPEKNSKEAIAKAKDQPAKEEHAPALPPAGKGT